MPKVMVITEKYYPQGGGAEVVTHAIVMELLKRGAEVTVISGTPSSSVAKYLQKYGGRYINYGGLRRNHKLSLWIASPMIPRKFKEIIKRSDTVYLPGIAYTALPFIRRITKDSRIIVHLHNYQPIMYSQFFIAEEGFRKRPGPVRILADDIRLLLAEYGYKSLVITPILPVLRKLISCTLDYSDIIIVPTKAFGEIMCEVGGASCDRILHIYNPVIMKGPGTFERRRVNRVIYVGGESLIKGYPIARYVAMKVIKERRDAEALFLGTYKDPLRNIGTRIRYLGKVPRAKLLSLMMESRVLLFPSIVTEPCPMSIIEAFYSGLLPVAFAHPTIMELYEKVSLLGFLCNEFDTDCLIEKVNNILDMDEGEYKLISTKVAKVAREVFNSDLILDKITEVLLN